MSLRQILLRWPFPLQSRGSAFFRLLLTAGAQLGMVELLRNEDEYVVRAILFVQVRWANVLGLSILDNMLPAWLMGM